MRTTPGRKTNQKSALAYPRGIRKITRGGSHVDLAVKKGAVLLKISLELCAWLIVLPLHYSHLHQCHSRRNCLPSHPLFIMNTRR